METFTITKAHIDQNGRYIGPDPEFDGNVLIEGGLGRVLFEHLSAQGSIVSEAGSGIKVDGSITVFGDFTVVKSIKAGADITAGKRITAGSITAGYRIAAGGAVTVCDGFTSGWGVSAELGVTKGKKA